jgi:enoyl-CoA hydratase
MDCLKINTLEAGILQISLNRPGQLNALSHDLLQQLAQTLQQAQHNKAVRAILLTGEGKGFCAGADIKELLPLKKVDGEEFARFGQAVFNELERMGKPSVVAIHGFAFGGGCELAMAATLRLATHATVFSQPEIKLGVIPGFGGTQRLARLIGKGRALEMCLTGRRFSAEEAWHWGLVNEITAPENLFSRAVALLKELTAFSPQALQSILTAIDQGYDQPLANAFALEATQFGLCCATADKQEGVTAFLEKRAAIFKGE